MNDSVIIRSQYNRFYQQFKCLECGKCCTSQKYGPKEGILLRPDDIERLCNKLGISKRKFKDTYTVIGDDQKRRIKYPCPLYTKEHGCSVYSWRTKMCHDYPVIGYDSGIQKLLVDSNCAGVQKMVADSLAKGGKHESSPGRNVHAVQPVAKGESPSAT